jgi:ubiquinone/menaquinone biosynthesis C-methylase UbiE
MPERYAHYGTVKILKADITKLPFEPNFFDVVICNHVLEHIPDDRRAMAEVLRVMKNGAWGIFQVPIDRKREITYEDVTITTPAERLKAYGQRDHVRHYGQDYPQRLENAGFVVTTDDYAKTFSAEQAFIYGINRSETLHVCRKL